MAPPPFDTTARDTEIERRYRNGETLSDIGASYDLSRERIRQILVTRGVPRRTRSDAAKRSTLTPHQQHQIQQVWHATNSVTLTAAAFPAYTRSQILAAIAPLRRYTAIRRPMRKTYTDTELLGWLRTAAIESDRYLSITTYNIWRSARTTPAPCASLYVGRFGGWAEALRRAGLRALTTTAGSLRRYHPDQFAAAVAVFAIYAYTHDLKPTTTAYNAWAADHNAPKASLLFVRTRMCWSDIWDAWGRPALPAL